MTFINCTPHKINLNDGRSYEPSGIIPRVHSTHGAIVNDVCSVEYGEIENLPEPKKDTLYVVSAICLAAAKSLGRTDCVAPATSHPDTVRNEKGHIMSVPCFVR